MMFLRPGNISADSFKLNTLNNSALECVSLYKYLGIWLDSKLSFKTHIRVRVCLMCCLTFYYWGKFLYTPQHIYLFIYYLYAAVGWDSLFSRRARHFSFFTQSPIQTALTIHNHGTG